MRNVLIAAAAVFQALNALAQIPLCPGETLELVAPDSLSNVVWSNGDSSSVTQTSIPGIFQYTGMADSTLVAGQIEVYAGIVAEMPFLSDTSVCSETEFIAFQGLDDEVDWTWNCSNSSIGVDLVESGTGSELSFVTDAQILSQSAEFTLSGTTADGCESNVSWSVVVLPKPEIVENPDVVSCLGDEFELNLLECCLQSDSSGFVFEWAWSRNEMEVEAGSGDVAYLMPNMSGDFELEAQVTLNSCTSAIVGTLEVLNVPTFEVVDSAFVCGGDSLLIEALLDDPELDVTWDWTAENSVILDEFNASESSVLFTAANQGLSLEGTALLVEAANGICLANDTVTLWVHPLPILQPLTNIEACGGDTLIFQDFSVQAASDFDVTWSFDGSGPFPYLEGTEELPNGLVAPNSLAALESQVTCLPISSGCVGAGVSFDVVVSPTPEVQIVSYQSAICPMDEWSISAEEHFAELPFGTTLTWDVSPTENVEIQFSSGATGSLIDLGIITQYSSTAALISLEVSAATELCEGHPASIDLVVQPALDLAVEGQLSACQGEEVMLVANEPSGRPYQVNWSTAQEEDFHSGGTYFGELPPTEYITLTATDLATLCQFEISQEVQLDEPVEYEFVSSGDLELCEGEVLSLGIETEGQVVWSGIPQSNPIAVSETGGYEATVVNGACAQPVGPFYVEVHDLPGVSLIGESQACEGDMLAYQAQSESLVRWYLDDDLVNVGALELILTMSEDTEVEVVAESIHGCINSDSVVVSVGHKTEFSIPSVIERCAEDSVVLEEPNWETGWTWSGLVVGEQPTVTVTPGIEGLIFVSTSPEDYCTWTDSVLINTLEVEPLSISGDIGICRGDTIMLELSHPISNIAWDVQGAEYLDIGQGATIFGMEEVSDSVFADVVGTSVENGCLSQASFVAQIVGTLPEEAEVSDLGNSIYALTTPFDIVQWGVTDNFSGNEVVLNDGVLLHSFNSYESAQFGKWVQYGSSMSCLRRSNLQHVMSISNLGEMVVEVFPNPASEFINVTWPGIEALDLSLINLTGEVVWQQSNAFSGATMDVGGLSASCYVLLLKRNGRVVSSMKVFKE